MKTKNLTFHITFNAIIVLVFLSLSACGGGGGGDGTSNSPSPSPQLPSKILSWEDPTTYTDGTPLVPVTDLDRIEIQIIRNGNPLLTAYPVSAVDPVTRQLVTSYDLTALDPFVNFQKGVTYFVTVRSVCVTGATSSFATPVPFSY